MKIVIVGAGPAGLAAARSAAEGVARSGADVTLIDGNHSTGGQIWRGGGAPEIETGVATLLNTRVASPDLLTFDKLILATGARELFLPFPGWTLPGVFGAGGLQALVKEGLDVRNKRVVVAGTGPLLLAVAHYLKTHGADIRLIAEQAPWSRLIRFGAALPSRKWLEALRLWNPCFSPSTWVTEAQGTTHVKSVSAGGKKIPCDYLAIGYGLVPNTELPQLMKVDPCALDEYQRTSNPAIFCAGEVTGIGGVDLSIVEGSIAGYAAAGDVEKARAFFVQRDRWKRFGTALAEAFALRPELAQLARPDTFVCRCEDVTYQELVAKASWREAKIHSRCGMGPCQGRVCGPAVEFLFGWKPDSVRPPLFPTPSGSFSMIGNEPQ
jgi:NADPH-dependent 2,4-dienoyl-CoA reductase/sulfur reductase-like enzyme